MVRPPHFAGALAKEDQYRDQYDKDDDPFRVHRSTSSTCIVNPRTNANTGSI
jgi:hypothetical protein